MRESGSHTPGRDVSERRRGVFKDEALATGDGRCADGASVRGGAPSRSYYPYKPWRPSTPSVVLRGERPRLRDPFSGSVPPQIKYFRDVPPSGFGGPMSFLRSASAAA